MGYSQDYKRWKLLKAHQKDAGMLPEYSLFFDIATKVSAKRQVRNPS